MKKALLKTNVSVKLRKAENADNWYLYIEAYPVVVKGKDKPQRVREYLNRSISTPIWDKKQKARTSSDGVVTYKPKRNTNGIIICKSQVDQDACEYADNVRRLRQKEYDTADIYLENEKAILEQNERSNSDCIKYLEHFIESRCNTLDKDNFNKWCRILELLQKFTNNQPLRFKDIDIKSIEKLRQFLLTSPAGGNKKGTISNNTASAYFSLFKTILRQAFIDEYLTVDIAAKIKNIPLDESRREYLTMGELNKLASTPCDNPIIRRAALFSAITGLRHSDIQKLRWSEIEKTGTGYKLNFTQKKTKGVEYMPISEQAFNLCGERKESDRLVFEGLPDPSWISRPLDKWVKSSGITKHITFHCFRHTYATLQLAAGTDIYTVSKMLGHTNVKTTQIYAKVIDEKKVKTTSNILIDINIKTEEANDKNINK